MEFDVGLDVGHARDAEEYRYGDQRQKRGSGDAGRAEG